MRHHMNPLKSKPFMYDPISILMAQIFSFYRNAILFYNLTRVAPKNAITIIRMQVIFVTGLMV